MNTSRTDHEAYQYSMPHAELRQMLIDAQQRSAPYHYDLHEAPASWRECLGWTVFAAAMLAVLAYSILFAIGCDSSQERCYMRGNMLVRVKTDRTITAPSGWKEITCPD